MACWREAMRRSANALCLDSDAVRSSTRCKDATDRLARACIVRALLGMSIDGMRPSLTNMHELMGMAQSRGSTPALRRLCKLVDTMVESKDEETIEILEIIRLEIRKDAPLEIAETWCRLVIRE